MNLNQPLPLKDVFYDETETIQTTAPDPGRFGRFSEDHCDRSGSGFSGIPAI
jgi:hypothetical protein